MPQLNSVVIRAEKSTVDIKPEVYNVGQDMLVKGGTVSVCTMYRPFLLMLKEM
jgi:hypothetical protein